MYVLRIIIVRKTIIVWSWMCLFCDIRSVLDKTRLSKLSLTTLFHEKLGYWKVPVEGNIKISILKSGHLYGQSCWCILVQCPEYNIQKRCLVYISLLNSATIYTRYVNLFEKDVHWNADTFWVFYVYWKSACIESLILVAFTYWKSTFMERLRGVNCCPQYKENAGMEIKIMKTKYLY